MELSLLLTILRILVRLQSEKNYRTNTDGRVDKAGKNVKILKVSRVQTPLRPNSDQLENIWGIYPNIYDR